ncbi:MAG: ATP-dependent RecD-like DNA helicase [Chloroflexota bacterium]|nr:ATP-dependent RecD-like DNA helicase [Chloroflexota bacterium]MDQ5864219.1 ATP-dependent RecD-like DNA helicase [Chloroflexota bacterium]
MGQPSQEATAVQPSGALETLDGVVDKITYVNEENGYTIGRLKVPRQKQLVTIAGHLPAVNVGEGLRVEGHWVQHPQYGRQFQVARYQTAAPGTPAALKKYLSSGLLKGVGPVLAEHIVNTFGLDTVEVLDNAPHRLGEVPGLGHRKAQQIAEAWAERRTLKDLMVFLQGQGVPIALAARILRKYGTAAETVVREQPYRLPAEVYGVTFQVADTLGVQAGIASNSLQRIGAGVSQVLREAASSGHVYLPLDDLLIGASQLLALSTDTIRANLPELRQAGFLALANLDEDGSTEPHDRAYLTEMHSAEVSVAAALARICVAGEDRLSAFQRVDWDSAWRFLSTLETVHLTEQQQEAIRATLSQRVVVVTGGPGTGKTTTLRGIVRLLKAKGRTVALAAPTGRAAKRLTEATGVGASTIHRLLELKPGGSYQVRAPIEADLVVVDEASMMDLPLADALLNAVPVGAHLLLVGDADQLPPVGAGSVFKDIIVSGTVPVITLETIFRQPEGSAIISNAHRINAGRVPRTGKGIMDFFFLPQPDPTACAQLVVDLATRRLPQHFKLDPVDDIQVLAPIYGGVCGVDALNVNLQAVLNPPAATKEERRFGGRIYRVGDKVMQVVNDYEKQVSNGELGRILRIDLEEERVVVSFDAEWTVEYTFQELDELTHAYAISVHKAQGSEYPAVIMPVLPQQGRMLQRNLMYTAVSRARNLVVLAGSPEAVKRAVQNTTSTLRYSGLTQRIKEASL